MAISRQLQWSILTAITAILILLAGCSADSQVDPTELADQSRTPIPTQVITRISTKTITPSPITPSPEPATPSPTATPSPVSETATPIPSATREPVLLPSPESTGFRPAQAALLRAPETGPESTIEWRPPPVEAPHALHPDDHYLLARPLPSDRRNYDLEVYPYGNMPVLRSLRPYRVHHGMDFPNDKGTPVFAASSGTVIFAGPRPNPYSGMNYYGNTVIILHDWQWEGRNVYTLYAHTLELFVEVGDSVNQGQLIAGVGASGDVSGPHLHLEVRVGANNYDSTRNPALWLAPFEGWGTLAGRFVDNSGRLIHGALVTVRPENVNTEITFPIRHQLTYAPVGINGDENWNENFALADLSAGEYTIEFRTAGQVYRRAVTVLPEITNFIVVQADFEWEPTAVPTPTPSLTPSVTETSKPQTDLTPTTGP